MAAASRLAQPANPMPDSAASAFCRTHARLVPMNTQSGILAIPQAWFHTGDAKPVRDLMRDLERVNRGETLSEP
jgi:hypothetical protein